MVLGDSDNMLVGDPVYTIGNPLGELTYTMTDGMGRDFYDYRVSKPQVIQYE